jgi:ribosomal-protein-serine acetyltransferase
METSLVPAPSGATPRRSHPGHKIGRVPGCENLRAQGADGYDPIDWENRTTALGYWLGEEFQGQGLVTAACQALVDHAFLELELNRVSIACATDNKRSCAIPKRLGFRREGVQRQAEWLYDHYVDHVVYATLASEWQTQRS